MLQDWTKYETGVLEGHTGPPGTTSRTTWHDIVPDGDIGALARTVRTLFEDCWKLHQPFGDDYDPAITNVILAYYRWSTQQSIHLHTPHDDPREWYPVGPPALEFYLRKDATTGAHSITSPQPTASQSMAEQHIPPSPTKPHTPPQNNSPQRGQSPPAHKGTEPPSATGTVQQLAKPLTTRHVPDNYQLPRGGNHTRSTAMTWQLPKGNIDWKKILPEITTVEVVHLLTPHQVQLTQAVHLLITTQGTATMEGTALGDDDKAPMARPTQAGWVDATADTDIAFDPDPEWTAVHYTLDCTDNNPTLTDLRTRLAAEVDRLDDVTLNDTLTRQTMEPAGRTARTHRDPTKHTLWHYQTTIHPEAVAQIKGALLRHPQRPPAGFVHNILEPCNRHRHGTPGRSTGTAAHRHSTRQGGPSHGAQGERRTSSSSNAPTTTPTKHSRQGAKYTRRYATKMATFSPRAHGWYTSY